MPEGLSGRGLGVSGGELRGRRGREVAGADLEEKTKAIFKVFVFCFLFPFISRV